MTQPTTFMDLSNTIASNTIQVIDVCLSRGAIKGEELSAISTLREQCKTLVDHVSQEYAKLPTTEEVDLANAEPENPSASSTTRATNPNGRGPTTRHARAIAADLVDEHLDESPMGPDDPTEYPDDVTTYLAKPRKVAKPDSNGSHRG